MYTIQIQYTQNTSITNMISTYTYFGEPVQINGEFVKFTGKFNNPEQPRKFPPFPMNCEPETYEDSYFMLNHLKFKVICIDRSKCNVLLLDIRTDRLYWSNNPEHSHNIEYIENDDNYDIFNFDIINTDKYGKCLGFNTNTNTNCNRNALNNGFCGLRSCQLQKNKFKNLEFSKLLTYRQLLGLCDATYDQYYNGFKWCNVCGFTTCPDATYQTMKSIHDNEWEDDEYDHYYPPCYTMLDTQFQEKCQQFYKVYDEQTYFEFRDIIEPKGSSYGKYDENRFIELLKTSIKMCDNIYSNKLTRLVHLIELFRMCNTETGKHYINNSKKFKHTFIAKIKEFSEFPENNLNMREIEKLRKLKQCLSCIKLD